MAGNEAFVALVPVSREFAVLWHQSFQRFDQASMSFFVVWFVLQDDLAIAIDCNPVVRIGQIFRREPKVEGMFAHEVERPFRRDFWSAGLERVAIELADERNMPHWKFPIG